MTPRLFAFIALEKTANNPLSNAKMVWSLEKKKDDIIPLVVSARCASRFNMHKSGAQKKKERRKREEEAESLRGSLYKYFRKDSGDAAGTSKGSCAAQPGKTRPTFSSPVVK